MTRIFLVCFGLAVIFSCSAPQREANSNAEPEVEGPVPEMSNQDLKNEVIAVHDEVMPRHAELRSLGKSLRELAESSGDQAQIDLYIAQANKADSAFQAMSVWMRQFEYDYEGSEEEEKQYFEGQLKQMNEVKLLMETALAEGQKLVDDAK